MGALHYSAPPVVGGVEHVMAAHTRLLSEAEYSVTIVAGSASPDADPGQVANLVLQWIGNSPVLRIRHRVRPEITWNRIFLNEINPPMEGEQP